MEVREVRKYVEDQPSANDIAVDSDGTIYVITRSSGIMLDSMSIWRKRLTDTYFSEWLQMPVVGWSYLHSGSIVIDASDNLWIAITGGTNKNGGYGVALQCEPLVGAGGFARKVVVPAGSNTTTNVYMAIDNSGHCWLAYAVYTDDEYTDGIVKYMRYQNDGTQLKAATQINGATYHACYPSVTIDGNGRVWMIWSAGEDELFRGKVYNTNDSVYKAEFTVTAGFAYFDGPITPIVDKNGRIWCIYVTRIEGGAPDLVYYKIYNSDGTTYKASTVLGNSPEFAYGPVRCSVDWAGNIYALFATWVEGYETLYATKVNTDYYYAYDAIELFTGSHVALHGSSWAKNAFNDKYHEFVMHYMGYEAEGVMRIKLDEVLPGEFIFAKVGGLY